jgi:hypothetical protein
MLHHQTCQQRNISQQSYAASSINLVMTTDCTAEQGSSKLFDELKIFVQTTQYKMQLKLSSHSLEKFFPCLGDTSLMKQQFVITHTIRQSKSPALLDSSAAHKKITGPYISIKPNMLKHWSINDLSRFFCLL